jgi:hypothetical protein
MTVEKQLETLQQLGSSPLTLRLNFAFLLATVGLLIAGFATQHPVCFMLAAFCGVVTYASWQSVPHIHTAAQALERGHPSKGTVQLTVVEGSDSPSYYATVQTDATTCWCFMFVNTGWTPESGTFPATLYTIPEQEWPALIQTEHGILYPRSTPERRPPEAKSAPIADMREFQEPPLRRAA